MMDASGQFDQAEIFKHEITPPPPMGFEISSGNEIRPDKTHIQVNYGRWSAI